ncbi:hypothetical protein I546_7174 [Mycobacterium kansasii 732]|nr:hypothetical protein I546_7174 [Mycobacterium kansasii 732]
MRCSPPVARQLLKESLPWSAPHGRATKFVTELDNPATPCCGEIVN